MPGAASAQVTRLLDKWTDGDPEALDQLLPLVYNDLKRIARKRLVGERPTIRSAVRTLCTRPF